MRRLVFLSAVWLTFGSAAYAQLGGGGEFRIFYQTIQSFDFDAGGGYLIADSEAFHGGGFGFVFGLNDWFGIYTDTTFLGGVDTDYFDMKLISQVQGAQFTWGDRDSVNLYGKAGIGFARFVIDVYGYEDVWYQSQFDFGGGATVPITEGMHWFGELKMSLLSLPNLTGSPDRDKWSPSPTFSTGVLFRF